MGFSSPRLSVCRAICRSRYVDEDLRLRCARGRPSSLPQQLGVDLNEEGFDGRIVIEIPGSALRHLEVVPVQALLEIVRGVFLPRSI